MFNLFKKKKPALPEGEPHPQHRNFARMSIPDALTRHRSGFLAVLSADDATQKLQEIWQRGAAAILPPEHLIPPTGLSVSAFQHEKHLGVLIVLPPPKAPGESHFGFIVAGPSEDWTPEARAVVPVRYFLLERTIGNTPTVFEWRPSDTQDEEIFDSHGSGPSPENPMEFVDTVFARFCGLQPDA